MRNVGRDKAGMRRQEPRKAEGWTGGGGEREPAAERWGGRPEQDF